MISLYAVGAAQIEVGKYTMSLEQAKLEFIKTYEKHNLVAKETATENRVEFEFIPKGMIWHEMNSRLGDLLNEVANVDDLHGDPPDTYILKSGKEFPPNTYNKTGSYND